MKKGILSSKTIWGILIMLAPMFSKMLDIDLAAFLKDATPYADNIIMSVGGILAAWGRWKANRPLGLTTTK